MWKASVAIVIILPTWTLEMKLNRVEPSFQGNSSSQDKFLEFMFLHNGAIDISCVSI